jgi:uncharacterized protein (TIGR03086 family)
MSDESVSDGRRSDGPIDRDPRITLGHALDQAGMVIARITPDQAGHPTPCESWDVGAVANHLMNGLDRFRATAAGETVDWTAPLPVVDGAWAEVFRERAEALAAAWAAVADINATTSTRMGERPMSFIVDQQVAELAQHAWDLAVATGQRDMLDDNIAAEALMWASQTLKPEFRGPESSGKAFGEQRPFAADAPTCDQLAAFFGRDPSFAEPSIGSSAPPGGGVSDRRR